MNNGISRELKYIITQLKKYLEEEKFFDRDEIIYFVDNSTKNNLSKITVLDNLRTEVSKCKKCGLHKTRIKTVFGEGNPDAQLVFIGEGPGYDEDRQGKPFVGKAGQLLTKIIESINLKRDDVYITNIVKCHPLANPEKIDMRGNDRPPTKEEIDSCLFYLEQQIDIIKPKIICTLGSYASQSLINTSDGITKYRGKIFEYRGIKLVPTYHPAALLRNPNLKIDVWTDMKLIRSLLTK